MLFTGAVNAAMFDGVIDPKANSIQNKNINDNGSLFCERYQNDEFWEGELKSLDKTYQDATQYIIDPLNGEIAPFNA